MHTEVESASGAWWSSAANAAAVVPALVDVVGDGLALLDHQGCFLGLNPAAVDVLGRPEAELAGQLAPFAISSDPQPAPGSRTTTWTGSGGRRRDLEYRVAPVPGIGHAVWFSDVTTVRRQQERLRAIVRAAASVAGAGS
ncbi:MAG TPA: PAS domain-containing protein, partial [Actinophytocola sp.]|nr:PAS domain-containing protein [Actinophytocola sp.]